MRVSTTDAASYAGSVVSLASSLTLSDVGIIVGILTALATLAMNAYFKWREDQREQRESDARLQQMGEEQHG